MVKQDADGPGVHRDSECVVQASALDCALLGHGALPIFLRCAQSVHSASVAKPCLAQPPGGSAKHAI